VGRRETGDAKAALSAYAGPAHWRWTGMCRACMHAPFAAASRGSGATGVTWNTDIRACWTPGICVPPPTMTTSLRSAATMLACLRNRPSSVMAPPPTARKATALGRGPPLQEPLCEGAAAVEQVGAEPLKVAALDGHVQVLAARQVGDEHLRHRECGLGQPAYRHT